MPTDLPGDFTGLRSRWERHSVRTNYQRMSMTLQVTFRHIPHSDSADELVRAKAEKLESHCDQISSCRVVLESPHRSHQKGNLHKVTIAMHLPGSEIIVDRSPDQHEAHKDLLTAIREAFDHAEREVSKYMAKRHVRRPHHGA